MELLAIRSRAYIPPIRVVTSLLEINSIALVKRSVICLSCAASAFLRAAFAFSKAALAVALAAIALASRAFARFAA
ncbi:MULTISPECIES: hypothetical protein [unclassified Coleofasciculus]|uniref:hypothetical protein n=1 Tax=unclassified Coleofasciculus TaxID=2692782 RepID=UPI00187E6594|nr:MULTISPECIES: hypothetical protein [unclassified Coleofasciculus]